VLDVDEIGPWLRYATAQVTPAQRNGPGGGQQQGGGSKWPGQQQTAPQQDQPWTPQQGGQQAAGGAQGQDVWSQPGQFDDETPF